MVNMVMSDFTLKGEHVMAIARLYNDKPVFDLDICGETLIEGAEYSELLKAMETIRDELEALSSYWKEPGRQLAEFNKLWSSKEGEADGIQLQALAEE